MATTVDTILSNIDAWFLDKEATTLTQIKNLRKRVEDIKHYSLIDDYDGKAGVYDFFQQKLVNSDFLMSVQFPDEDHGLKPGLWFERTTKTNPPLLENKDVVINNQTLEALTDPLVIDATDTDITIPEFADMPDLNATVYNTRIWKDIDLSLIEEITTALLVNGKWNTAGIQNKIETIADRYTERSKKIRTALESLIPTYTPRYVSNIQKALNYFTDSIFKTQIGKTKTILLSELAKQDFEWATKTATSIDEAHINFTAKYTDMMLRIQDYLVSKDGVMRDLFFDAYSSTFVTATQFLSVALDSYMSATEKQFQAVMNKVKIEIESEKSSVLQQLSRFEGESKLFSEQNSLIIASNKFAIEDYGNKLAILLRNTESTMDTLISQANNDIAALSMAADAYVGLINTATQSVVGVVKE